MQKFEKIKLFFKSKKTIKPPSKNNFMIYDFKGSKIINSFLKLSNYTIYYNRFEKIHILTFITSLIYSFFQKL